MRKQQHNFKNNWLYRTISYFLLFVLFLINPTVLIAAPPTHDAPTLTSALGTLTSTPQNTFDADGDDVKNIFNWYKDTVPLQVLNMPFEGGSDGSSTKDYSDSSNDGTVTGTGATWNATGGHDGKGAYEFDGSGDRVLVSALGTLSTYTFTMWLKPTTADDYDNFVFFPSTNSFFSIHGFDVCSYTSGWDCANGNGVPAGQWTHVAITSAGNVYYDGVYADNINVETMTGDMWLGARVGGWQFLGSIDEVQIFNEILSAEQIANLAAGNPQIIDSEETTLGETWQSCVTPNDGTEDGITKCSN
ncbi:MAG: LamG domain-containing protein, partial [Gammaproteobacteria bacterium]|nr:LamG domain-containing protein [Gammaproteobacteria bacterium]